MTQTTSTNTGKVLTRRSRTGDFATLRVSYPQAEATELRWLIESIVLKRFRKPSMALIARRALTLYINAMHRDRFQAPDRYEAEVKQLESMVTVHPTEARSRRRRVTL